MKDRANPPKASKCRLTSSGYRIFLFVAIAACMSNVSARVTHGSGETRLHSEIIESSFGFESGGRLRGTIQVFGAETDTYLLLISMDQWRVYRFEEIRSTPALCFTPCTARVAIPANGTKQAVDITLDDLDLYRALLANCNGAKIEYKADLTFTNPDGDGETHLSYEDQPLIDVNLALLLLYTALLLPWLACLRVNYSYVTAIHKLMAIAIAVKVFELSITISFLKEVRHTGVQRSPLGNLDAFTRVLSSGFALGTLLFIALGWSLTRRRLSERERQMLPSSFGAYLLFGTLYNTCEEPNICGAYLLSFYVIKFLVTFCIIVGLNTNIERLRSGTVELPGRGSAAQVYELMLAYMRYRWAFLAYLILPIALMFIEFSVLSWKYMWLVTLLNELFTVSVYAYVYAAFAPRKPTRFALVDMNSSAGSGENRSTMMEGASD